MSKKITIALAGNPNSGKSTIFNNLTGVRQHVGNYPGVTVEKKEGYFRHGDYDVNVVDLPGIYSLNAQSMDEIVARDFIVDSKPDVVIDVVDASNLERNLYLAVQIMELGVPLILALNMADIAEKKGLVIDKNKLSRLLGLPIVFTVATKNLAMQDLISETINLVESDSVSVRPRIRYGNEIGKQLKKLREVISKDQDLCYHYPVRWLAVKVLEQDPEILEKIEKSPYHDEIVKTEQKCSAYIRRIFADDPEAIIAERRYGFITGACDEAIKKNFEIRHNISDIIDTVLLNRLFGLPIFFGLMWLAFKFVFLLSEPLIATIEWLMQLLSMAAGHFLEEGGALHSLIVEGVIGGVGSVLVFIPVIYLLFLAISFLEDSGYLARAAFLMDKFMHKIGLHGRSFIPMLLGFGCSLPAIMATRTIEDEKDRLTTLLVIPFMSCGARLPIYALFIGAFFQDQDAGNLLFIIYFIGVAVAVIIAKIFRKYLFPGIAAPFVMELPPYRVPTFRAILIHMWEKGVLYIKKAGTVIFAGGVIMWFLSNFPWNPDYEKNYGGMIQEAREENNQARVTSLKNMREKEKLEKSFAGRIGKAMVPAFKPLGFEDWRLNVGLIGGFFAKEIVVATLGTLYVTGPSGENNEYRSLRQSLRKAEGPDGEKIYTPLKAFAIMIFCLLYLPCIATIGIIRKETNSWKWPLFTVFYTVAVAWIAAFLIYHGGLLLGLG